MSEEEKKKEQNDVGLVRTVLLAVSFIMLVWFVMSAATFYADHVVLVNDTHFVETTDTPIFSLHDGSQVTGHFILGSGSVEGEGYYAYYVSTGPARSKRMTVMSDYTELVEDEEKSPYIREFVVMEAACTLSSCDKWPSPYHMGDGWYRGYKKWELHVPNGTLTREMEVGHA